MKLATFFTVGWYSLQYSISHLKLSIYCMLLKGFKDAGPVRTIDRSKVQITNFDDEYSMAAIVTKHTVHIACDMNIHGIK